MLLLLVFIFHFLSLFSGCFCFWLSFCRSSFILLFRMPKKSKEKKLDCSSPEKSWLCLHFCQMCPECHGSLPRVHCLSSVSRPPSSVSRPLTLRVTHFLLLSLFLFYVLVSHTLFSSRLFLPRLFYVPFYLPSLLPPPHSAVFICSLLFQNSSYFFFLSRSTLLPHFFGSLPWPPLHSTWRRLGQENEKEEQKNSGRKKRKKKACLVSLPALRRPGAEMHLFAPHSRPRNLWTSSTGLSYLPKRLSYVTQPRILSFRNTDILIVNHNVEQTGIKR